MYKRQGDELAVGLVAHGELREAGDDERIDDAEENRRDDSEADRDDEGAAHGCALVGTVAVSYTHLDVYKRQDEGDGGADASLGSDD